MDSAFQVGEQVQFTQPYLEGTVAQFPQVVITHVHLYADGYYYKFRFVDEGDKDVFVWFPESMFKKEN